MLLILFLFGEDDISATYDGTLATGGITIGVTVSSTGEGTITIGGVVNDPGDGTKTVTVTITERTDRFDASSVSVTVNDPTGTAETLGVSAGSFRVITFGTGTEITRIVVYTVEVDFDVGS